MSETAKRQSIVSSQGRLSKARKSTKTWINDTACSNNNAKTDALVQGHMAPEAAVRMVGNITKFATVMCVVIAVIKVGVYLVVKSAVVKTSALDSMGDLIANMITMYTGYRMAQVDIKNFPIGQSRFEPVGVLVFSTLMAAMMFGNALGNLEDILDGGETEREEAVGRFWQSLFGNVVEKEGDVFEWPDAAEGWKKFQSAVAPVASGAGLIGNITEALKEEDFEKATKALEDTIGVCSEVEDPELKYNNLVFQDGFLACCATYKFCLWLFVACYAAPKTGSTVLVALGNDKRNDFVATSFVIICSILTYKYEDELNEVMDGLADKMDPIASLLLSSVIIYTWCCLLREQVVALSGVTVEEEMLDVITAKVKNVVGSSEYDPDVKAYYSSHHQTVEVDLVVVNGDKPFKDVHAMCDKVKKTVQDTDEVERVVVCSKLNA